MYRCPCGWCCCITIVWTISAALSAGDALPLREQVRRPVAIAVDSESQLAWVANERSGTLSVIDLATLQVIAERDCGERLADLQRAESRDLLLALDSARHQLVVLRSDGPRVIERSRVDVSPFPVRVAVTADGRTAYVTSLWSHQLSIVDLTDDTRPQLRTTLDVPFAPRAVCLLKGEKTLLVTAAFGGQLVTMDTQSLDIDPPRELDAHNIYALAPSHDGRGVVFPHQQLHANAATTEGGVHWGGVMSNVIRTLPYDDLESAEWPPLRRLYYLGNPDNATGDPMALVITREGRQLVTFAGLGELGISDVGANFFSTVAVGLRPTAVALTGNHTRALVANTLSDSVSVIDIDRCKTICELTLGPRPPLSQIELGERLFYDARLSSDGWFSCHSCHTEGHTNGLLSDNLGDGDFGAPKRVLSLAGAGETGPWAWNGSVEMLADQIRKSIELTMRGPAPTDAQVDQLAAFLLSLPPVPGRDAARRRSGNSSGEPAARGAAVFQRLGCADCHLPPTFTSPEVYDVEIHDRVGNTAFNPPSLRGVSQHFRLLHDNRAEGLRDLFDRLQHGTQDKLSPQELEDLISYLQSL